MKYLSKKQRDQKQAAKEVRTKLYKLVGFVLVAYYLYSDGTGLLPFLMNIGELL